MFTNELRQTVRRAKLSVRAKIKRTPALYIPLARTRNGRHDAADIVAAANPEALRRDTELVLEAPESSANTFAVMAFRLAQGRPVTLAHHLHAAAQIKLGVKRGVPTMVILRNPQDVVTSHVIRHPPITLEEALREWCDFYETIGGLSGFLMADFTSVTNDFGVVIDHLNRRFNTNFVRFEHTDANVRRVFDIMDEVYVQRGGAVARPMPEREAERSKLVDQYLSSELDDLRTRADELYDRMSRLCVKA